MKELQTVALGLIVVFVDVGSPDWVADPVGWLLVLVGIAAAKERLTDYGYLVLTAWVCLALSVVTWPPESVPTLDETLGWVFSLPTIAFCFMLADSLTDVTKPELATRFRVITWVYALVTVLPLLPLLLDWEWVATPAQVLAILVDVVLVISLFSASDEDAVLPVGGKPAEERRPAPRPSGSGGSGGSRASASGSPREKAATAADRTKERAKETAETVSDNVRTAAKDTARSVKDTAQTVKEKASADDESSSTGSTSSQAEPVATSEGRHKA